jgi:protein-L-isoaspartate(D-aspartate) O-methyltransferase
VRPKEASYVMEGESGQRGKKPSRFLVVGAVVVLFVLVPVAILWLLPGNRVGTSRQVTPTTAPSAAAQPGQAGVSAPVTGAPSSPTEGDASRATSSDRAPPAAERAPAFDITSRQGHPPTDSEEHYVAWMTAHSPETERYLEAKWERARVVIQRNDATDPRVIEAFLRAPREYFCLPTNAAHAYGDAAMPIGYGQTISGPHLVSHMTQALDLHPDQKVLEIGTGSGYQSAVLAELSNHVYTIEIVRQLAQRADSIYRKWSKDYPEYENITRKHADGYYGWPEYAPFDRIIVTAGIDHIPPDLLKQLKPGGIMLIPVGPPSGQTVLKITKEVQPDGSVTFKREDIYHGRRTVIFVPFTSATGKHTLSSDTVQNRP